MGTANSDQNFTEGIIILHFSQWGRNLRDFLSPGTNFGLIFKNNVGVPLGLWNRGVSTRIRISVSGASSLVNIWRRKIVTGRRQIIDSFLHFSQYRISSKISFNGNRIVYKYIYTPKRESHIIKLIWCQNHNRLYIPCKHKPFSILFFQFDPVFIQHISIWK